MKTMIAIPSYNGEIFGKTHFILNAASKDHETMVRVVGSSFLPKCFNQLFCLGLNARSEGLTHWCMLHSDIVPEAFFLDKMHKIMEAKNADVLSVVSPIKDARGMTSCGIDRQKFDESDPEDAYKLTRFTMNNIYDGKMPKTFTHEKIMINTGLMLVDMRKPWVEKICFKFINEIKKVDGKWNEYAVPEDWQFSRDLRALGAKAYVTSEVKLDHFGFTAYSNAFAWGNFDYEKGD